jgi:hypothetical protein
LNLDHQHGRIRIFKGISDMLPTRILNHPSLHRSRFLYIAEAP